MDAGSAPDHFRKEEAFGLVVTETLARDLEICGELPTAKL